MKKIIYHIACSVDGFIADPKGDFSMFIQEGEHAEAFYKHLNNYDTVLMGANTYEIGLHHGLALGDPAYPNLRHYIVSSRFSFPETESVKRISTQIETNIHQLKQTPGKDIWLCGGGQLANTLLKAKLIDELILKVNPLVLGTGLPLFADLHKTYSLKLTQSKTYNNGIIENHYTLNYT